jgi:hypothetical protein
LLPGQSLSTHKSGKTGEGKGNFTALTGFHFASEMLQRMFIQKQNSYVNISCGFYFIIQYGIIIIFYKISIHFL